MGANPHLRRWGGGLGAKPLCLGCFCAYIGGCRGISALLFSPPKTPGSQQGPPPSLLGGWKGFAQIFIDNHTKKKSYFSDF